MTIETPEELAAKVASELIDDYIINCEEPSAIVEKHASKVITDYIRTRDAAIRAEALEDAARDSDIEYNTLMCKADFTTGKEKAMLAVRARERTLVAAALRARALVGPEGEEGK